MNLNDENLKKMHPELDFDKLNQMNDKEASIQIDKLVDKNDKVLEKDYLSSLLQQEDRLLYYEIENIYKNYNDKLYKNKLSMKKSPPVLIIKDDLDNEIEFVLTENFVDELSKTLNEVKRAYFGYSGPLELDIPDKIIDKIIYYAKRNPIKIAIPIILITYIFIKLLI